MTPHLLNRRSILIGPGLVLAGLASPARARLPLQGSSRHVGQPKTIRVDTFLAGEAVGGSFTADGMTNMLTQALVRDGRFLVAQAEAQDNMAASAIIRGAVMKFRVVTGGGHDAIGATPGGWASNRNQSAVIELAFLLVDTATSQVVSAFGVEGRISQMISETGLAGNIGKHPLGGEEFRATHIGQAGEDAMDRAVFQIAIGMLRIA